MEPNGVLGSRAEALELLRIEVHRRLRERSGTSLAKVMETQGQVDAAEQMLHDDVFDRRDDYEPPVDLPTRTKEIVKDNGSGQRRKSPASNKSKRPATSRRGTAFVGSGR